MRDFALVNSCASPTRLNTRYFHDLFVHPTASHPERASTLISELVIYLPVLRLYLRKSPCVNRCFTRASCVRWDT